MARRSLGGAAVRTLLVVAFVAAGGGMALGQQGWTHSGVSTLGSESHVRTRGVAAGYSATVAHVGEYWGQLLQGPPPATMVGWPTVSTAAFLEVRPLNGTPSLDVFVDMGNHSNLHFAASLGAVAFNAFPRESGGGNPNLFAAGWFEGDIGRSRDGGPIEPLDLFSPECDGRDAFVISVPLDGVPGIRRRALYGPGNNEALAIASGPPCSSNATVQAGCRVDQDLIVVGGYFHQELNYSGSSPLLGTSCYEPSQGSPCDRRQVGPCFSSGFAVLLNQFLDPRGALGLTSTAGNVRIHAVAMDRAQDLYVAGSFQGNASAMNFNPHGHWFGPSAYWGGTELFVAKYTTMVDTNRAVDHFALEWLYTLPRSGNATVTSLAIAPDGTLFACGYVEDAIMTMSSGVTTSGPCLLPRPQREIWIARFDSDPLLATPYHNAPQWSHIIGSVGDEAAYGIALDAWQRPVITGSFGYERCNDPTAAYNLDFNPVWNQQFVLTTAGGHDAFVAGFDRDGTFREAFRTGGAWNEQGNSIAIAPAVDFGMHIGGYFGSLYAPGLDINQQFQYLVDFDPGTGASWAGTYGNTESFVSTFTPTPPASATIQLSLVIEGLESYNSPSEWDIVQQAYAQLLSDPDVLPADGTVALNVVLYEDIARDVIPWTLITQSSRDLFVGAFKALQPVAGQTVNYFDAGMVQAAQSIVGSGVNACWRYMHVHVENYDFQREEIYRDARDTSILLGVDQINGLALMGGINPRDKLFDNVIRSSADHPLAWPNARVAFAGEVSVQWRYSLNALLPQLHVFLQRQTRCPGDFNRDGSTDSVDWTDFETAILMFEDYADWNRDGQWSVLDEEDFAASHSVQCPCP
jgi:hypothetical protein